MRHTRFTIVLSSFLLLSTTAYAANPDGEYQDEFDEFKSVGMGLLLKDGQEVLLEGLEDNSDTLRADKISSNNTEIQEQLESAFEHYKNKEYKPAFEKFISIARAGHVQAQQMVGLMYTQGQGVNKDEKQAFRWLEKAAHNFDSLSMHHVGVRYFQGLGVKKNVAKAAMWLTLAAEFYGMTHPEGVERVKNDLDNVLLRLSLKQQRQVQNSVKQWKTQNRGALKSFLKQNKTSSQQTEEKPKKQ